VAHLNLYAVTETGERVLMTKDHIVPRSRGGANQHENYQTMCIICNQQKADGTPEGA
jgi:5-methylcytosine-specific restriction endonuclease McrA